jgi:hypothetical protein
MSPDRPCSLINAVCKPRNGIFRLLCFSCFFIRAQTTLGVKINGFF